MREERREREGERRRCDDNSAMKHDIEIRILYERKKTGQSPIVMYSDSADPSRRSGSLISLSPDNHAAFYVAAVSYRHGSSS